MLYVELATRGGKDRVRPGGGRRFTLVVGELNQSLVSEGEREGRGVMWRGALLTVTTLRR